MTKQIALALVVMTGCASEELSITEAACSAPIPIRISVDGLAGGKLTVKLDGERYTIKANGTRTLAGSFIGVPYELHVTAQPTTPPQTCTVVGGSGTVTRGGVTIPIHCAVNTYAVGGTVSGLAGGGLALRMGSEDLAIAADGAFAFPALVDHSPYAVSVTTQPTHPSQDCVVTNGAGTLAGANVTNVAITCTTRAYTIGGAASGVAGSGLVVKLGASLLPIAGDGPFAFPLPILDGSSYAVEIASSPAHPNQTCTLANDTGIVNGAPVSDVTVSCTTNMYAVGGTVSGLAGEGLVLALGGDQLAIEANGPFEFPTPLPDLDAYAITVTTSPAGPRQSCSIDHPTGIVDGGPVNVGVTCVTLAYPITASISGLAGHGLVLRSDGIDIPVAANGTLAIATLDDLTPYDITIASQPTEPNQVCTIANGAGTIDGAAVEIAIACTTTRYTISGVVTNHVGTPLVLRNGGETVSIAGNGAFTFPAIDDFSTYDVIVATQPTAPNQVCAVTNGGGQLHGANIANIAVDCAAPGNLRITEVGNCSNGTILASCWLEVFNTSSTLSENLSLYRLRSRAATRTFPFPGSERTFVLPSVTIAPRGYAVIRGRASDSAVSGGFVIYLLEASVIPSWGANGYAELLANGRTIDFLRWGGNPTLPTSGAFAGSAPNLSTSTNLGFVIARDLAGTDTDAGTDWAQRGFGTPGGANDITSDTDDDTDGIPDQAEVAGGTFAGLDLFAMGARTNQRDVFVQIDRMFSNDAGLTPRREALDKVVATFAARGIAFHFDVGPLYAPSFDPSQYNLGGGNQVPYSNGIAMAASTNPQLQNFYALKVANFDVRLQPIAHYMIFAWSQGSQGLAGSSGLGEINGNDTIISFGGWGLRTTPASELNLLINYQASTIMHELGHNFGLRHGGSVDQNYKPNYLSIMNYTYQLTGLPLAGAEDGTRYYLDQRSRRGRTACPFASGYPGDPRGPVAAFRIDYSDGSGSALDENAVSDPLGLRRPNNPSVDFDCNGVLTSGYQFDVDGDGLRGLLNDFNDWANLRLAFLRVAAGNDSGDDARIVATDPDLDLDEDASEVPIGDIQPTAVEEPPPPAFFESLH